LKLQLSGKGTQPYELRSTQYRGLVREVGQSSQQHDSFRVAGKNHTVHTRRRGNNV
jgi:hypothetical protein